LANKINWSFFDEAFKKHYSEKMGKPAKSIRLIVSLLILKYIRKLSDVNLVEQLAENIYFNTLLRAAFHCKYSMRANRARLAKWHICQLPHLQINPQFRHSTIWRLPFPLRFSIYIFGEHDINDKTIGKN
jgi:hypothetical protein